MVSLVPSAGVVVQGCRSAIPLAAARPECDATRPLEQPAGRRPRLGRAILEPHPGSRERRAGCSRRSWSGRGRRPCHGQAGERDHSARLDDGPLARTRHRLVFARATHARQGGHGIRGIASAHDSFLTVLPLAIELDIGRTADTARRPSRPSLSISRLRAGQQHQRPRHTRRPQQAWTVETLHPAQTRRGAPKRRLPTCRLLSPDLRTRTASHARGWRLNCARTGRAPTPDGFWVIATDGDSAPLQAFSRASRNA